MVENFGIMAGPNRADVVDAYWVEGKAESGLIR